MFNYLSLHPRRFALLVSLVTFALYASTTPNFNVGYGDSDEFLVVGKNWGLAHPPGYILYTTLLYVVMRLGIPFTTMTQRAHLLSGVMAAIVIYFTTLTLFVITREIYTKKDRLYSFFQIISVLTTIIALATAKLYWLYAQITEKYIFAATLVSIILYVSSRLVWGKKPKLVQFLTLSSAVGLLLAHHQSMVFLLPFVVYVYAVIRQKLSTKIVLLSILHLIAAFILPQILLYLRANPGLEVSWYMNPGFQGIIDFITRADFRGNIYYTNTESFGYVYSGFTVSRFVNGVTNYLYNVLDSYTWWIIVPLVVFISSFKRHNWKITLFLSLPFILIGIALAGYINWPEDAGSQATTLRFYVPSFATLAPLVCVGLFDLISRLAASVKMLHWRSWSNRLIGLFIVCIPIVAAVTKISIRSSR